MHELLAQLSGDQRPRRAGARPNSGTALASHHFPVHTDAIGDASNAATGLSLGGARTSSALRVACTFALAIASGCTTQMREGLVLRICDHG